MNDKIDIKNKKAYFEYNILDKYIAGIKLQGTEIKSIRESKVNLGDGYCFFRKGELWIKNMHISEYSKGTHFNHEPLRDRKLLLNKKELRKIETKVKEKGITIIPLRMFISERGYAKLEIGMGTGKKLHDKRQSIKDKEVKREMDRTMKKY